MANTSGVTKTAESNRKSTRSALQFKYYIHDSVDELRFQLIGFLTEASVPELSGCWNTAKTILGTRRLTIDLQALQGTDEVGKQWLLSLAYEGANYSPDSYFRDVLAAPQETVQQRKMGFVSRVLSSFRGRNLPVESSTRAQ